MENCLGLGQFFIALGYFPGGIICLVRLLESFVQFRDTFVQISLGFVQILNSFVDFLSGFVQLDNIWKSPPLESEENILFLNPHLLKLPFLKKTGPANWSCPHNLIFELSL
jgi:hypothetical protein